MTEEKAVKNKGKSKLTDNAVYEVVKAISRRNPRGATSGGIGKRLHVVPGTARKYCKRLEKKGQIYHYKIPQTGAMPFIHVWLPAEHDAQWQRSGFVRM